MGSLTAAADGSHLSGAMIALMPTPEDAERLAIEGGEAAEDLHLTLYFLGDDGAAWAEDQRNELIGNLRALASAVPAGPVTGVAFGANHWNPNSDSPSWVWAVGDDRDRPEGTASLLSAKSVATVALETSHDLPELPVQHSPWVPHICAAYSDELDLIIALEERLGPVTFDRVRVAFGGDYTDIPLAEPLTAAAGPLRRQPTELELASRADFAQMDKAWHEAVDATVEAWATVQEAMRAEITASIQAAAEADDLDRLDGLTVDTEDGARLLIARMIAYAREAGEQQQAEAEAQGVDIPEWSLDDEAITAAAIRDRLRQIGRTAARVLGVGLVQSAVRQAMRVWGSGSASQVAAQVDEHLAGLSGAAVEQQVGAAMTAAQNEGRFAVLAVAPPAEYTATEILDKNSCKPCREIDGTRYTNLPDARAAYPSGGYTGCLGGARCRGTLVTVWPQADEQAAAAGMILAASVDIGPSRESLPHGSATKSGMIRHDVASEDLRTLPHSQADGCVSHRSETQGREVSVLPTVPRGEGTEAPGGPGGSGPEGGGVTALGASEPGTPEVPHASAASAQEVRHGPGGVDRTAGSSGQPLRPVLDRASEGEERLAHGPRSRDRKSPGNPVPVLQLRDRAHRERVVTADAGSSGGVSEGVAMPYSVVEGHADCGAEKPWAVIKQETDELMGCHETEAAAMEQQAALYAEENDEQPGDDGDANMDYAGDTAPWEGVLAVEGIVTGDGREFAPNALTWADLPVPLRWNVEDSHGGEPHTVAVNVGRIDRIWRDDNRIMGAGVLDLSDDNGRRAYDKIKGEFLRGVSIDADSIDQAAIEYVMPEGAPTGDDADLMDMLFTDPEKVIFHSGRIRAATLVDIPAFAEAYVALLDEQGAIVAGGEPVGDVAVQIVASPEPARAVHAMTAGAAPWQPPAAWFSDPKLSLPTPITITDDGRIYGHAAQWGSCHIGQEGVCVQPPHEDAHPYYRTGEVKCDDGSRVAVGQITVGTGHAPLHLGASPAAEHYDNTGAAVADVAVGNDAHGIWVAGAVRPGADPLKVYELQAAGQVSGDWRRIGGELRLVGLLAVNVPGFPVPKTRTWVASGQQVALVAAGRPTVAWGRSLEDQERHAVRLVMRMLSRRVHPGGR